MPYAGKSFTYTVCVCIRTSELLLNFGSCKNGCQDILLDINFQWKQKLSLLFVSSQGHPACFTSFLSRKYLQNYSSRVFEVPTKTWNKRLKVIGPMQGEKGEERRLGKSLPMLQLVSKLNRANYFLVVRLVPY